MAEAARTIQEKFANKIKEENNRTIAVLASSGIDVRASKITTYDFLAVKKNTKISKMLATQKESGSAVVFSDYMYMIREDNLAHKSKRILYITEYSIYVLHPTSFQIQRITPITDLKIVIIVKSSGTLLALHYEKAYSFFLPIIEATCYSKFTGESNSHFSLFSNSSEKVSSFSK